MEEIRIILDGPADLAEERFSEWLKSLGVKKTSWDRRKAKLTKKAEREIRRENRRIARLQRREARKTK